MASINIKGQEYSYLPDEIIDFTEGLVGLPEMRRAVLIPLPEFEPFFWLASLDDQKTRFIVVNPHEIFADYEPSEYLDRKAAELKTLVIVKISSDWQKTTVNLRAPILINEKSKRGVQTVLSESPYNLSETLPQS
jgi:flagellar assembly factor FliW